MARPSNLAYRMATVPNYANVREMAQTQESSKNMILEAPDSFRMSAKRPSNGASKVRRSHGKLACRMQAALEL